MHLSYQRRAFLVLTLAALEPIAAVAVRADTPADKKAEKKTVAGSPAPAPPASSPPSTTPPANTSPDSLWDVLSNTDRIAAASIPSVNPIVPNAGNAAPHP